MNNLMVDIETLGVRPYAVILRIAAVEFDIQTGNTGKIYDQKISIDSCRKHGLQVETETTSWWCKQILKDEEGLNLFLNTTNVFLGLKSVLINFKMFIEDGKYLTLWGNSNSFDLGLLANAYEKAGIDKPWIYEQERDVRTIVGLRPEIKEHWQWSGVAHNPVDDCKNQIGYLVETLNSLTTLVK